MKVNLAICISCSMVNYEILMAASCCVAVAKLVTTNVYRNYVSCFGCDFHFSLCAVLFVMQCECCPKTLVFSAST